MINDKKANWLKEQNVGEISLQVFNNERALQVFFNKSFVCSLRFTYSLNVLEAIKHKMSIANKKQKRSIDYSGLTTRYIENIQFHTKLQENLSAKKETRKIKI